MNIFSLLYVDANPIYCAGMARVLAAGIPDLRVVTAHDLAGAMAALEGDDDIDVCLAEQRLSDGEGVDLVALVRHRFPKVAIGLLSDDATPVLAALVRARGGISCFSKNRDPRWIIDAVKALLDGSEVFEVQASDAMLLTERRRAIVKAAAAGHSDKQICAQLDIAESTVRNHWHHIFGRLGAANRTEAVTKAMRLRLI